MRARMYDPRTGRFTQTDPVRGNRPFEHYAYVSNNPVSLIDPRGLQEEEGWLDKLKRFFGLKRDTVIPAPPPPRIPAPSDLVDKARKALEGAPERGPNKIDPSKYRDLDPGPTLFGESEENAAKRKELEEAKKTVPKVLDALGALGALGEEEKKGEKTQGAEEQVEQTPPIRNPAQDKKLSAHEIDELERRGINAEELKGGDRTGRWDLYKDKQGNVYIKPKGGGGEGEPTGINLNEKGQQ